MTALLPRLLADHGPLPPNAGAHLIDEIERAGLRGHGGAAFPTAKKMRAVAANRRPKYVVVNGTEGEPASKKDRVLLRDYPQLVLDGLELAAEAVGADTAFVAYSEADVRSADSLATELTSRPRTRRTPKIHLVETPDRYLSGQETALVSYINGGPALPTFGSRPYVRGIRNRPTLVQNAETMAHIALIARYGADWFRQVGTERDPGTALITLSGAVERPGVYEIEHGMPLSELLSTAGVEQPLRAVLLGGYFGSWLPAGEIANLRLSPSDLRPHGAGLGAGVIVALPATTCPVNETARIIDWFDDQNAGQCGPCVNGLGAIADTVGEIAAGTATAAAREELDRWTHELPGRGACQHPDGAVKFVRSAMKVFANEFADHAVHGACSRCARRQTVTSRGADAPAMLLESAGVRATSW